MPQQKLVEIDDASLEVLVFGTGERTICTTHPTTLAGLTGSAFGLTDAVQGVATVAVVSPRGGGKSSPAVTSADFSMSQLVEDLERVRKSLGYEHWMYAGGSAGGYVGLLMRLLTRFAGRSHSFLVDSTKRRFSP